MSKQTQPTGDVQSKSTSNGKPMPANDIHQLLGDGRFLSVREAAQLTGVSASTIRNWCRTGGLPALQIGHVIRISEKQLAAFLRKHIQEPK